ncbi:MAG: hypothetical protein M3Z26_17450 [Bacteroidota bacterium]|nr:hypothetical protein [Bacteroidota bacterium]
MSLDNIQINSYLCEKMYSKSLVGIAKKESSDDHKHTIEKNSQEKIKINSLGENEGNILFVVNSQSTFLDDGEMKLLMGLLSACKISMQGIALVNYAQNSETNYKELVEQFKPEKVMIFGISASDLDLPFTIPFFQIQKFQDQLYMISPALSEFIDNIELKKELWNSLKKIFLFQK